MDSGGYTYLLIRTAAGKKDWTAVTKTNAKKGGAATVTNTMEMKDFTSPTLKRKFNRILFGMLSDGATPAADPHAGALKAARASSTGPLNVAKASGPEGRTIAEIHARKKELKGKDVVVAGEIVKYNSGILERNWAHLRDGSGNAKDGSDDITVILQDDAELGQVITARGKVVLDKDLGGVYKFPVALEDAAIVK